MYIIDLHIGAPTESPYKKRRKSGHVNKAGLALDCPCMPSASAVQKLSTSLNSNFSLRAASAASAGPRGGKDLNSRQGLIRDRLFNVTLQQAKPNHRHRHSATGASAEQHIKS